MDGMLYASVAHPPVFGSTVKTFDDKAALAVAGVKQTATIDGIQAAGGISGAGRRGGAGG